MGWYHSNGLFCLEQRHLSDSLGAVVLVGARVGGEAVLAGWGGGFAVGEDVFHDGDMVLDFRVRGLEVGGEVDG